MSLNKFNIKSFLIIATLILLVRVNVYSTVYTTVNNGNWNNKHTWSPSIPNMTWGFTDTVYIKHQISLNNDLDIFGYFVVENGAVLSKSNKSITIKQSASLINNGTLEVKNLILDNGNVSLVNNGNMILHGSFTANEGEFVNNSDLTVASNFTNSWSGNVNNNGTITVSGTFTNSNNYDGLGSLSVNSNFTNDWGASFTTTGELIVGGNLLNSGTASFDNSVSVGGNLTNNWSSSMVLSDTVLVTVNVINNSSLTSTVYLGANNFTNSASASFTSAGTVKFTGNVANSSSISNSGTFDVSGNFTNDWSTYILNTGDFVVGNSMINKGSIDNIGLMYVQGDLNNISQIDNSGNLFVDASVTGYGSIAGSGVLCHSDGQTDPTGTSKSNNVSCDICDGTVNTLPVELVAFDVKYVENTLVAINWTTATEENNDYFEVLHSTNGIDFETITRVKGAGNSNIMINYQVYDYNAANGVNYYQLKQVDYDGKTTLSDIQTLRINGDKEISLYPNPANIGDMINVEFTDVINYSAEIFDITGRLVMRFEDKNSQMQISTSNLSKGNYILRIIDGEQSLVKRFIVK